MADARCDVVVIGGGLNGLVCAALSARAGQSVLVLEATDRCGGSVRTDELTVPGYRHDTHAALMHQFTGSPVWEALGADLGQAGLRTAAAPTTAAALLGDGTVATLAAGAAPPTGIGGDAEAWRGLADRYRASRDLFAQLQYAAPTSPAGAVAGLRLRSALGDDGVFDLVRSLVASARSATAELFGGPGAAALTVPWTQVIGLGPDDAGGGLIARLSPFVAAQAPASVPIGGAGTVADALVALIRRHGGQVRTGQRVERIELRSGRASAVRTAGGLRALAARAVVASVTPGALYTELLAPEDVADVHRLRAARFRFGPAAAVLHLALDGPAPWAAGEAVAGAEVVLPRPDADAIGTSWAEGRAGRIPRRPAMIVQQPTAADPSRAPAGGSILWVLLPGLPVRPRGGWGEASRATLTDRALAELEACAPGLGARIVGRRLVAPPDLTAANPNLVDGDPTGGSVDLDQNLVFRPGVNLRGNRTPIDGLWHIGASTTPGPGVGVASGWVVGTALTERGGLNANRARQAAGLAATAAQQAASIARRLR